ncbi:MAG: ATP-binding protein [Myxococcota bacterium]|nr:ATP-binding protein [Myxococcota bacterium]
MIYRTITAHLRRLSGPFPVIFLTGPRQSGKTTLAKSTFPSYRYCSFEDLQTREEAIEDPKGFLSRLAGAEGIIIDEAQHVPDLFSYVQGFVDDKRAGPVILTGSQHFLLAEKISQTLAGRAGILELLPFSIAELDERSPLAPDDLFTRKHAREIYVPQRTLNEFLLNGLFPPIHDRGLDPAVWYDSYTRTYIERDVRSLSNVGDLDTFTRFLRLCAGRAGQLLNMTALGSDAGMDQKTIKRWLSILRTSYIIDLLHPHHVNYRKRLVKTPKLYFIDTGLLCSLLGIRSEAHLLSHPLRGAVFENFVVTEMRKTFSHSAERPSIYFWRDSRGREIDVIVERSGATLPIEIKAGETVAGDAFNGLDYYNDLSDGPGGILIYGGKETFDRGRHLVCSWGACC